MFMHKIKGFSSNRNYFISNKKETNNHQINILINTVNMVNKQMNKYSKGKLNNVCNKLI